MQPSYPYALLAVIYHSQKQYDLALVAATHAIGLDRHDDGAIVVLSELVISLGQPQAALTFVQEAYERRPEVVSYAATMGHAYRVMGRYEEAVAALQEALRCNPNVMTARAQLSVAYSQLGWDELAWAEMQRVLRNLPALSADEVKRRIAYKDPVQSQQFYALLEKVGLQ
jgi:tetratricopeptide (TPR) repeat protein